MSRGENCRCIASHWVFACVFIALKIVGLIIAVTNLQTGLQCSGLPSEIVGSGANCAEAADCRDGYVCGFGGTCACIQNATNIPPPVPAIPCRTDANCTSPMICSVKGICDTPGTCEVEYEKGFTLAIWLLIFSIVGLTAGVVGTIYLCRITPDFSLEECEWIAMIPLYCLALAYAIYSVVWGVVGFTLVFGQFAVCEEVAPALWGFSLFNSILMVILVPCNPATIYFAKECGCFGWLRIFGCSSCGSRGDDD